MNEKLQNFENNEPVDGEVVDNLETNAESKKLLSYKEAVDRYKDLKESVPEAEKLIFNERPARSDKERVVAKLDLQIQACEGQAEAFEQSGDAIAERGMRMLGQFKEAEKTIMCLYFDAMQESPEFAEILRSEHPWLGNVLEDDDYSMDVEHSEGR